MPGSTRHDLVVFGGGIIGLATTWWASTEGLQVAVVDPDPGRRAAWATAGMPAPVAEARVGEEPLAAPNMATVRAWPGSAAERESVSDTPVHFRVDGTLLVAGDRSDRVAAGLVLAFHRAIGLSAKRLGARSCCQAEPLLNPGISGGVDLPDDYRVGTRSAALIQITACRSARVDLAVDEVARLHLTADRVDGAGRHRPAPGRERVPHLRRTVRAPARQLTRYLAPRDDGARCPVLETRSGLRPWRSTATWCRSAPGTPPCSLPGPRPRWCAPPGVDGLAWWPVPVGTGLPWQAMSAHVPPDPFVIARTEVASLLILATSGMTGPELPTRAVTAPGTVPATGSVARFDPSTRHSLVDLLSKLRVRILPYVAECSTERDAVLTARLALDPSAAARVKLEFIGGDRTLLPAPIELVDAAARLVDDGFVVLANCGHNPEVARRLEPIGCSAVMPLGAPMGPRIGIHIPHNIELIVEQAGVPVILDAGFDTASGACQAMEIGCSSVLITSAVTRAEDPGLVAATRRAAVTSGRAARRAGRITRRFVAEAPSSFEGMASLGATVAP
jgi:thiazole synthase